MRFATSNVMTFGLLDDLTTNTDDGKVSFWAPYSIGVPDAQSFHAYNDVATTVSQLSVPVYLNLSAATYAELSDVVALKGWTIMKDSSGKPLEEHLANSGMQAVAFENTKTGEIVISYEGTNLGTPLSDISFLFGQLGADSDIKNGITPQADLDALAFAQQVESAANGKPLYVTGHSLGGEEAEYVEAHASDITGGVAGGAVFGAPGVPQQSIESGSNFANYLNWGDVIGGYVPSGGGHVGAVEQVGNPEDPITENQVVSRFIGDGTSAGAGLVLNDHSLQSGYASFFNVTLPTSNESPDSYGIPDLAEFGYIIGVPLFGGISAPHIQNGNLAVNGDLFSIGAGPSSLDLYDSQNVDVFTAAGQTANATSLGVVSIVNEGANSTISAGSESKVLIVNEGNGSSLIGGTGADTFVMESAGNTAASSTVSLTSSSKAVIEGTKDTLTLAGKCTVACVTDGKNPAILDASFTSGSIVEVVSDVTTAAGQNTFTFGSSAETLKIDQPTNFTDVISNFQIGDKVNLKGVSATQATLAAANVLVVQESNGSTLSLQLAKSGNFSGDAFSVDSDGKGGTNITVRNPDYSFTTLNLDLSYSRNAPGAIGINASGEVAGTYLTPSDTAESFLYHAGGSIALFGSPTAPYFTGIGTYTSVSTSGGFQQLSDTGEVVGFYQDPNDANEYVGETYLYDGGVVQALDPSGERFDDYYYNGFYLPSSSSGATSVNSSGTVAGSYIIYAASNDQVTSTDYGFIYENGVTTTLDVAGSVITGANLINNSGEVAGIYNDGPIGSYSPFFGYTYQGGKYTTFSTPTTAISLNFDGINSSGALVGTYEDTQDNYNQFLYQNGKFTVFSQDFLADSPMFINSSGLVAGTLIINDEETAFLYNNGSLTTLNIPGMTFSVVAGVTDSGLVVGTYGNLTSAQGFVDFGGAITPVNVPGATLTYLEGVNASGELVGDYENASGLHIFTATPTEKDKIAYSVGDGSPALPGNFSNPINSEHASVGAISSNARMAFMAGAHGPATLREYIKELSSRVDVGTSSLYPKFEANGFGLHGGFNAANLELLSANHFGEDVTSAPQARLDTAVGSLTDRVSAERAMQTIGHCFGHAAPL